MERDAAERTLARLEHRVNVEQSWGPVITFVQARHGLLWGDRYRALSWVQRDAERYASRLGADSTMGPLLVAAEVDLLLSVGRGDQALARLNRSPDHPTLTAARARLELLAGRLDEAARLAAEVADVTETSRVRLEGLVVSAAAAVLRLGQTREAHEACRLVQEVTVIRLTNQGLLMLRRLASFRSQKELADAMYLSLNTVKTHLRAAYQKLGVSSRAEGSRSPAGRDCCDVAHSTRFEFAPRSIPPLCSSRFWGVWHVAGARIGPHRLAA